MSEEKAKSVKLNAIVTPLHGANSVDLEDRLDNYLAESMTEQQFIASLRNSLFIVEQRLKNREYFAIPRAYSVALQNTAQCLDFLVQGDLTPDAMLDAPPEEPYAS